MYDQLTENDIRRLKEEIQYRKGLLCALTPLKRSRRPESMRISVKFLSIMRPKGIKIKMKSRIRYLERMIKTAKVVSDTSKADEVGLNNTVELYFEDEDECETYKIVTTIRENSLEGRINNESPIGKAIMGHKAGDRVFVKVNEKNGYYVVIRSIENRTHDGSDRIRSF